MKIIIGNCYSQLDGYTPELYEAMSVSFENYFYSPRYKMGLWDGQFHFLKIPSKRFPTGLLFVVTETCDAMGLPYEIVDMRTKPGGAIKDTGLANLLNGITLRDYQEEAAVTALALERGCLEMATGSGKTEVAAAIIKLLGLRTLFLVHTKDLLRQTKERFENRLGCSVGKFGEGQHDLDEKITVATVQSVSAFLKRDDKAAKDWLKSFQVMFLDECHHQSASTWYRVGLLCTGAYYRFGLSGTIMRRDILSNMKMLAIFGEPIYRLPASELIERGYLAGIVVHMVKNPEVVTGRRWQDVYDQGIVHSDLRNQLILDLVKKEYWDGSRIMILIRNIAHGELFEKKLNDMNIPAVFLHGSTASDVREGQKKAFDAEGDFVLIASVIFQEGVDIPNTNVIIVAAGGKSEVAAIQRIGRGLRKKEDASPLVVYDFLDSSKWLKTHSSRRVAVYRKEKFV